MTTPAFLQPGQSLQRERRGYSDDFTDQHGRRFAAQYELSNARPIGELAPVGFQPPLLPPMSAIVWGRHGGFRFHWDYETHANNLVEMSVQYYASVMDFMLEHMKEYVAEHGVPELGEPVPAMVIRSPLGSPPMSPAFFLACQEGNPWALGVPGAAVDVQLKASLEQSTSGSGRAALLQVRERLARMRTEDWVAPVAAEIDRTTQKPRSITDAAPLVMETVTYQQFFASCRSRPGPNGEKMSMDEIVSAWNAHKALLAESDVAA